MTTDDTTDEPSQSESASRRLTLNQSFARRSLIAASITAAVVLLLLLLWYAVDVLLLVFSGVLFSVFLRGAARLLRRYMHVSRGLSLLVVTLTFFVVVGVGTWLVAGRVATQADELAETLPRAVQTLSRRIEGYGWGRQLLAKVPSPGEMLQGRGTVLARATGVVSGVLGVVVNILIIMVVGLYLAFQRNLYTNGIIHLIPFPHRPRARQVIDALDDTLSRWLVGRLLLMVVTGSITALGLWLLGVPLALTLGLLVGILGFIPNIGPLIAAAPAILIALMQSPRQALYVGLLYVGLQTLDGYVLTPLVDRKSVELPPVLTITSQVLLGVLLGIVGVILASPLTAVVLVLVRMLYVENVIGDFTASDNDEEARQP